MFVCVCLLFGILSASAIGPTFHYNNLGSVFRRYTEDCKLCYGEDCLELNQTRCQYYVEADEVLREESEHNNDNPQLRADVDSMVFGLVEKASTSSYYKDCIPLISHYTDCTKENICTGCKSCNCEGNGRWNCAVVEQCRADDVDIDHRVLVIVMETLTNDEKNTRLKRSIEHKNKPTEINTSKLSFEEISEWLYGAKPIFVDQKPTLTTIGTEKTPDNITDNSNDMKTTDKNATLPGRSTAETSFKPEIKSNLDYLAFDEVLNNIAVDNKNYSRKKLSLDVEHNDTLYFDYINIDEDKDKSYSNLTDQFVYTLDVITENSVNKSNAEGTTKVVIDLLQYEKRNEIDFYNLNGTDYADTDNKISYVDPTFEEVQLNAANVMKRDVSSVINITDVKTEIPYNITSTIEELKRNVLIPLSNIISDKQKELNEMLPIRESLIKFIKSHKNDNIEIDIMENITKNRSSSYFSIYKLDIEPQFLYELDSRRNDPDLLEKYLNKLKRDIHEVMRDIIGMRQLSGFAQLPDDLKILLRAIKHYANNQDKLLNKGDRKLNINKNTRRQWEASVIKPNSQAVRDELVNIIQFIDKNMPESNALAPLSLTTKKIITRIIKQNYVDEFAVIGLRVSETQYNLTNDLRNIGVQWQVLTKNIAQSSVFDKLYAMKLLHFVLSVDMGKMTDALALIDFAHSRRMIPLEGRVGEELMDQISNSLSAINDKIQIIIKLQNSKNPKENTSKTQNMNQKKSFMQKLRNMLRSSKKDIANLLQKKVPKAEIVKELAKKKLDEFTRRRFMEYEETMKKWQSNLDLSPRKKRSTRDMKLKNRIKNIIPRYLRGKVNPAIAAKSSKKSNHNHGKVDGKFII